MEIKAKLDAEISQWQESFYLAQKEALKMQKKVFLCLVDGGVNYSVGDVTNYSIRGLSNQNTVVLLDYVYSQNVIPQLS